MTLYYFYCTITFIIFNLVVVQHFGQACVVLNVLYK